MATHAKTPRVLLSKFWLDVHDRGLRYVAHVLRDAGMEIVYLNYRSVEDMVNAAIQEDVDCIGVSYLAGGEDRDVPALLELLRKNGLGHVPVILGGVMDPEKPAKFIEMGVKNYFGPGSDLDKLVQCVSNYVHQEEQEAAR